MDPLIALGSLNLASLIFFAGGAWWRLQRVENDIKEAKQDRSYLLECILELFRRSGIRPPERKS